MAHAKSTLAETTVKLGLGVPTYSTKGSGPRHDQVFTATVTVGDEDMGRGIAKTKREAERLAAEEAISVLEARDNDLESDTDARFEGPWPIFEHVLASAIEVAERRMPGRLSGEEARVAIRDFSLELYKDLLEDLGDVVDDDDDDSDD